MYFNTNSLTLQCYPDPNIHEISDLYCSVKTIQRIWRGGLPIQRTRESLCKLLWAKIHICFDLGKDSWHFFIIPQKDLSGFCVRMRAGACAHQEWHLSLLVALLLVYYNCLPPSVTAAAVTEIPNLLISYRAPKGVRKRRQTLWFCRFFGPNFVLMIFVIQCFECFQVLIQSMDG